MWVKLSAADLQGCSWTTCSAARLTLAPVPSCLQHAAWLLWHCSGEILLGFQANAERPQIDRLFKVHTVQRSKLEGTRPPGCRRSVYWNQGSGGPAFDQKSTGPSSSLHSLAASRGRRSSAKHMQIAPQPPLPRPAPAATHRIPVPTGPFTPRGSRSGVFRCRSADRPIVEDDIRYRRVDLSETNAFKARQAFAAQLQRGEHGIELAKVTPRRSRLCLCLAAVTLL